MLTYLNIFSDVRETIDWVHNQVFMAIEQLQAFLTLSQGTMKAKTLQDLPKYVKRDARLPILLKRSVTGVHIDKFLMVDPTAFVIMARPYSWRPTATITTLKLS